MTAINIILFLNYITFTVIYFAETITSHIHPQQEEVDLAIAHVGQVKGQHPEDTVS